MTETQRQGEKEREEIIKIINAQFYTHLCVCFLLKMYKINYFFHFAQLYVYSEMLLQALMHVNFMLYCVNFLQIFVFYTPGCNC